MSLPHHAFWIGRKNCKFLIGTDFAILDATCPTPMVDILRTELKGMQDEAYIRDEVGNVIPQFVPLIRSASHKWAFHTMQYADLMSLPVGVDAGPLIAALEDALQKYEDYMSHPMNIENIFDSRTIEKRLEEITDETKKEQAAVFDDHVQQQLQLVRRHLRPIFLLILLRDPRSQSLIGC